MEASALFSHESPTAVIAYRRGVPVTAQEFLADAVQLATRLPASRHVLNVCLDRYRFTVGLAACLMTQRISLLPSTHTPEVIRQLTEFAPDVFCLTDEAGCNISLPRFLFPADLRAAPDAVPDVAPDVALDAAADDQPAPTPWSVPQIPSSQLAAIVFTSGSTGTPLPYQKTWGRLSRCVRDGAPRLGLLDGQVHTLIGTVPAQHMYGFESTVLLALLSGNAFSAERPFYPADIAAAVEAVPRPRALISTPIHLRALLAAGIEPPAVDLIVSATAPLDLDLAREVEAKFHTRLLEIYGSTETGQIATRRTAASLTWHLWPGVRLSAQNEQVFAHGGHVEQRTAMCDVLEITGDDEFLLHGRTADLVNVAGKRSSFAYLNMQLNSIPGVVDGAFFLRETDSGGRTGVTRLAAVVVAPGLSTAQLTDQLRLRIDAVFLPRPLLLVDELPRNATGKLPHQALLAFAEQHVKAAGQQP
jgi:acyl-coenzyme A synthetase/AMP-(fatty) acid ligase